MSDYLFQTFLFCVQKNKGTSVSPGAAASPSVSPGKHNAATVLFQKLIDLYLFSFFSGVGVMD